MSLTSEDVEKIARLARLTLEQDTLTQYAAQLSGILGFVEQMNAVATDDIEPMAHPLDLTARLRADAVTETDQREAFLALAPAAESGLFLVPKVID